jgi:hypothetical protein
MLVAGACTRDPVPCTSAGSCSSDSECLANRCVPLGSDPVALDTRRIVLSPSVIAVVSSRGTEQEGSAALPSSVTFGGASEAASALYLRFEPSWRSARRVDNAFLVLEPLPGTPGDPEDVPVEAWRIAGRWQTSDLSWVHQPKRAPPFARGLARSSPPSPLRIDVTAIVRHWHEHARSERGLVVKSAGGGAFGASFATGASGGAAPRLELYVR